MNQARAAKGMLIAVLAGAGALGGCSGHGKHTTEGKNLAQEKAAQIKSATQWDMAKQQYEAGDLRKALMSVDQSIALKENVPKSHLLKGRILLEIGRLEASLASFERALELEATNAEAYYYSGIVHERFSQSEKALERYQLASNNDPANPQYALAAAEMLIDLGRLDDAQTLLSSNSKHFEHNAGIRQTQGHIAMMKGDALSAVKLFNEAFLLAPEDLGLQEDLARAQLAARRFGDAEFSLRRLISADTSNDRRDLKQLLARALVEIDRPVDARAILLELTKDTQGARDIGSWIELGNVALVLKDQFRVREAGTRLVGIAPNRPEGYVLLAIWQRNAGQLEQAVITLDRAIAAAPDDLTAPVLQGVIYGDLNKLEKAASSFALALERDPQDERAQRLLAGVEARLGRVATVPTND